MLLQPLERGIQRTVFHQQFFFRNLLDGACDPLTVLGSKDQRTQDQRVHRALEQFEPFPGFLGRHLIRVWTRLGKISTQRQTRIDIRKLAFPGRRLKATGRMVTG